MKRTSHEPGQIDWPEHQREQVRRILRRAAQRMLDDDLEQERKAALEDETDGQG